MAYLHARSTTKGTCRVGRNTRISRTSTSSLGTTFSVFLGVITRSFESSTTSRGTRMTQGIRIEDGRVQSTIGIGSKRTTRDANISSGDDPTGRASLRGPVPPPPGFDTLPLKGCENMCRQACAKNFCDFCHKAFGFNYNLTVHLKTDGHAKKVAEFSRVQLFKCEECELDFSHSTTHSTRLRFEVSARPAARPTAASLFDNPPPIGPLLFLSTPIGCCGDQPERREEGSKAD
ncbi:hypothetical protein QBC37DRAFT_404718 [Rhypophila decipiens]|uniref:C2H2-type domain-containing protein n=1 Tax=Rhypophila decipiens TaxID=261697 RepID=A0AAN6Y426_9PEZI|nr:hypothetical protein QBC37DRAFT_404718 [Rhypophila decipiens]